MHNVILTPDPPLKDYRKAMEMADNEAKSRLGNYMLLSWYDRDRDFESPQHSSEYHLDSATPGYVDYGINHGATLRIDIEDGRFIFFLPVCRFPDSLTKCRNSDKYGQVPGYDGFDSQGTVQRLLTGTCSVAL